MAYPELLERKQKYKKYRDMNLYTLTRDLHHICEDHPVGASMSRGDVPEQWWADWLYALFRIHHIIDEGFDSRLCCVNKLQDDLEASRVDPRGNIPAGHLCEKLRASKYMRDAARYVLTGAHLMGGQVMRKSIGDRLPASHLEMDNRKEVLDIWRPYRERVDIAEETRDVFRSLIFIMDKMIELDDRKREATK